VPSRPVPKTRTSFPYLRLDIAALKMLVEELRHVDEKVTIETDRLKDIESVDALVGLKPAALRGLTIISSAKNFGEYMQISIPGGLERASAFYRPETDESRSKAEVYLRVCALLDDYCVKGPLRALTAVRYLFVFTFGFFISLVVTDVDSHHKGLSAGPTHRLLRSPA